MICFQLSILYAQFRPTFFFNNIVSLQNYKTDNPKYDLRSFLSYSPELMFGLQGANIAIFSLGLKYQMMGGQTPNNQRVGSNYAILSLHITFLWKIQNSHFQWFINSGLEYGYATNKKLISLNGIDYDFHNHYWGLHLSPGIEYSFHTNYAINFQFHYALQINDASKNFFIGKFHSYGMNIGIRYLKN